MSQRRFEEPNIEELMVVRSDENSKQTRDRLILIVTILVTLGLVHVLGDPKEGSQSFWALIGHRMRGAIRIGVGMLVLYLAWLGSQTAVGVELIAFVENAKETGDEAFQLPLMIPVLVSACWFSWGFHGLFLGRNWVQSGPIARVFFMIMGCGFLMLSHHFVIGVKRLWERQYYWNNPRFLVLKARSEEMKALCSEGFSSYKDQHRCLSSHRERMEEMRADVEELVVKYPSLKSHDVFYSLEKESEGGGGEVFSYPNFLLEYEFKVQAFDRISNQF